MEPAIDVRTRYAAASNEINQRINSRHISYLGHVTAAAAILTILINKWPDCPMWPNSCIHWPHSREIFLVLSPAMVSIAFGCWIRAQDLTIGMLSTFCRVCEQLRKKTVNAQRNGHKTAIQISKEIVLSEEAPAWHRNWWRKNSMAYREWMEVAFVLVNVLVVLIATLFSMASWDLNLWPATTVLFVNYLLLGLSSWMVLSIAKHRNWLASLNFSNNEAWHGSLPLRSCSMSLHPTAIMGQVGLAGGSLAALLGCLCHRRYPHPVLCCLFGSAVLVLAIAGRALTEIRDWQILKRVGKKPKSNARFFSAYWMIPISLAVGAIVLFAPWKCESSIVRDWSCQVGLWISAALLGYAIPEFIVSQVYWRRLLKRESEEAASTAATIPGCQPAQ